MVLDYQITTNDFSNIKESIIKVWGESLKKVK